MVACFSALQVNWLIAVMSRKPYEAFSYSVTFLLF